MVLTGLAYSSCCAPHCAAAPAASTHTPPVGARLLVCCCNSLQCALRTYLAVSSCHLRQPGMHIYTRAWFHLLPREALLGWDGGLGALQLSTTSTLLQLSCRLSCWHVLQLLHGGVAACAHDVCCTTRGLSAGEHSLTDDACKRASPPGWVAAFPKMLLQPLGDC